MPNRSFKNCARPGCRNLTKEKYCVECADKYGKQEQKEYDLKRGTAHQRGYTSRWQRYSKRFLSLPENQFCKMCGELAECVDHIIPVKGKDDPNFWNRDNHQSLCLRCNTKKGNKLPN